MTDQTTTQAAPAGNGATLSETMERVKDVVGSKYLSAADDIRAVASEFRKQAEFLEKLADQVVERAEKVKSEVSSAVDFHTKAAETATWLREHLKKMIAAG